MKGTPTIKAEVDQVLDQLSADDQQRVLDLARMLAQASRNTRDAARIPASDLMAFFQQFAFAQEERDKMAQILTEIDP